KGRAIIPADLNMYRRYFQASAPPDGVAGNPSPRPRDSRQGDRWRGLPTGLASLHDDGGVDSATHVEARGQSQEARTDRTCEVIGDLVGHRLVKGAAVPEGPDVELQRLQLHAQPVRYVFELQRRKIRLACLRTQTGEFRQRHADRVVAIGGGIGEALQLSRGSCRHAKSRENDNDSGPSRDVRMPRTNRPRNGITLH